MCPLQVEETVDHVRVYKLLNALEHYKTEPDEKSCVVTIHPAQSCVASRHTRACRTAYAPLALET